jgi:hypothetical protein
VKDGAVTRSHKAPGGLQKGGRLYLALGYQVPDAVEKKRILGHIVVETKKVC